MSLPWEIFDRVLLFLPRIEAYRVAVDLRRLHVRDAILLKTSSACPISACERGIVSLLEWWAKRKFIGPLNAPIGVLVPFCIEVACQYGKVNVLDWFMEQREYPFICGEEGLDYAAGAGHVSVFEWFKGKGLRIKVSSCAVNWASANNNIDILDWLKENTPELSYNIDAIYFACKRNHISTLRWWDGSGLPLPGVRYHVDARSAFAGECRLWWEERYPAA